MSRERLAWLVSVVLLALLAFQLPGSFAQRDDEYGWVKTLVQVHREVDANYVEPVDDTDLNNRSVQGMLSGLDPYTIYVPPAKKDEFDRMLSGTFKGVGITLDMSPDKKVTVITPIEGSPADRAGIQADDVIIKVNGQSIEGLPLDEVVKRITGPVDTDVTLTIWRDGQELSFTLKRQEIVLPTVRGYDRKANDSWNYYVCDQPKIAYVRITQFDHDTFQELKDVLEGAPGPDGQPTGGLVGHMQGLILDLRFNPGGQLEQAVKIVNLFVKQGVIVSTRGRARPEQVMRADGQGTLPDFPMIVLVNDKSASAAEIVSGSLKDNHRALIVGQRTFGKGSVQEVMPLDNGGELKLTVAYYYLPSGRLVHRKPGATDWGVEPQIIVPVDEQGEEAIREEFEETETIRHHATSRSATKPTTNPVDPQLQQALNTMIGLIVLNGNPPPATQPTQ